MDNKKIYLKGYMTPVYKAGNGNIDALCKKLVNEYNLTEEQRKAVFDDFVNYYMSEEGEDEDVATLKASKEELNLWLLCDLNESVKPDYYITVGSDEMDVDDWYIFKIYYEKVEELSSGDNFENYDIIGDYDKIVFEGIGDNTDENTFYRIFSDLASSF